MITDRYNKLFKAYDIRGKLEDGLNSDFYYNLGKAVVTFLNAKRIAVGYDIRTDSKEFSNAFIKGATKLGCDVYLLGEVATEHLYYSVGRNSSLDGGISITASHNPVGYNGAKIVGRNLKGISGEWGLPQIKRLMLSRDYLDDADLSGTVTKHDIHDEYKNYICKHLKDLNIKDLKIVIDAGNGIGGKLFDNVFKEILEPDNQITRMYFKPDGSFPNHVPNPMLDKNTLELEKEVLRQKADLGIAIDGDADRIMFIDSKGRKPSGTYIASFLIKNYFIHRENKTFVYEPRVVFPYVKDIMANNSEANFVISNTGHTNIRNNMRKHSAIFGAEHSAHFYFKDFFFAESSMLCLALVLNLISKKISFTDEMDKLYAKFPISGEINYELERKDEAIKKIKDIWSQEKVVEFEGLSIESENWRFNLRKSNTESVIRLNIEGTTMNNIKTIYEKLDELIRSFDAKQLNKPKFIDYK